ncbi:uncharacterized protein ACRADG_007032 [Cochliomyia hominivorax]
MHSTTCGVGASTSTCNSSSAGMQTADGLKMGLSNNDDAMNKIPLKSVTDDEEKNGGEFIHDTATAEEARREQRRVKLLNLMKKLTIGIICFIGIALISYVIISLCFSEWPKSTSTNPNKYHNNKNSNTTTTNTNLLTTTTTTTTTISPIITTSNSSTNTTTISNSTTTSNLATITTLSPSNNPLPPPSASPIRSLPITFKSSLLSDDNNTTTTTSANNTLTNSTLAAASIVGTTKADTDTAATAIVDDIATLNVTQSPTDESAATGADTVSLDVTATLATPITTTTTTTEVPSLRDIPPSQEDNFSSTLGVFQNAAVCSDKPVCSRIGSQIMKDGGSAVDAAIASLFCVGLTTPQSMGIGGGMLMNIYIKNRKQAFSVDAREIAPFAATEDMFNDDELKSLHGPLSIAVPGEVMGYGRAHNKFGKLPWEKLLEPSLKLCKEGFYMTRHLSNAYMSKFNRTDINEMISKVFVNQTTKELHPVGTKLYPLAELCNTYQLLATNGAKDFYNGTLAKLVAADLQELGSIVTYDDLESYRADLVSSVTMQLGNDILYAIPPISSGTIVANIMSILEGFNFTKSDLLDNQHRATVIHRIAEALKFGFAKRWELGDMRFNDVRELVSRLTNPESGIEFRKLINDTKVLKSTHDYGAQFSGEDDIGTSPLVVMAANGDAVAVTSTVNDYFGSAQIGKRTGIVFNSAMNDFSIPGHKNIFSLPPSPSNFISPQKRPMSSMSPMILTDQKANVRLALSAAGGSKIISAIVDVMTRVLWFNQNIKEAIDAPRFHSQLVPNVLAYQKDAYFSEEILKLLADKGHVLEPSIKTFSGAVVCGIVKNSTAIYANADYRKRGGVAAFSWDNEETVIVDSTKLRPPNVEIPQPPSSSRLHVYEKAAVCSDKNICSNIGSVILQHEGNAIDSAIATLLCNGLVTMQSMGLGGGVFMTYYNRKEKKSISVMGRERAPLYINLESIKNLQNASSLAKSPLAIAVPGELFAYHEAHSRYGSLPWAYLVKPTLELCYQGYTLTRHQRNALYLNEEMIRKDKLLQKMFVDPKTEQFFKEGWHIELPEELCYTYKLIMEEGPLTFYNGLLASLVVKDLNEMGSWISEKDLIKFKIDIKDTLVVDLGHYYVHLPLPPASGHVVGFVMKILQKFQNEFSLTKTLNSLQVHRIVEALKFGFVKRWQYDSEVKYEILNDLFSDDYIQNLTYLIKDLKTFNSPDYYGAPAKLSSTHDYGTAQISVLAPNGDAVSATSSINFYFGSGRMGQRSGILFNNALSDFNIGQFQNYFNLPNLENINELKPQKQPMSSMAPLIVTNKETGDVRLVIGAAGGSRIISTLVQILIRILWQEQNIKQAIDAPRFHHQLLPNILEYEFGVLQQVVEDLENRGHQTERIRRKCTAVCGVERVKEGIVLANADYRKEGGVDGF